MNKLKFFKILSFLLFILVISIFISCIFGYKTISLKEFFAILYNKSQNEKLFFLIFNLRLPQILTSALTGAILALSGLNFQTVLKNPLTEPYILGIASGASFFAVCAIIIGINNFFAIQIASFLGALIVVFIVLYLIPKILFNKFINLTAEIFVISGVIVGLFFNSLQNFLVIYSNKESIDFLISWSFGNLNLNGYFELFFSFLLFLIILIIILLDAKALNTIQISDELSISLGYNPFKIKKRVLLLSSFLTSISVGLTGIIGFVGLIIPHITKILFKYDNKINLVFAPLIGAIFMVFIDLISRTFLNNIPPGILTSLIGVPFFILVIIKKG